MRFQNECFFFFEKSSLYIGSIGLKKNNKKKIVKID